MAEKDELLKLRKYWQDRIRWFKQHPEAKGWDIESELRTSRDEIAKIDKQLMSYGKYGKALTEKERYEEFVKDLYKKYSEKYGAYKGAETKEAREKLKTELKTAHEQLRQAKLGRMEVEQRLKTAMKEEGIQTKGEKVKGALGTAGGAAKAAPGAIGRGVVVVGGGLAAAGRGVYGAGGGIKKGFIWGGIIILLFVVLFGGFIWPGWFTVLLTGTSAFSEITHGITETIEGITHNDLFSMILNPQQALQFGMAAPTVRDPSEISWSPPTIGYTVTGAAIPDRGCVSSTLYNIIARIQNTGSRELTIKKVRFKQEATNENFCHLSDNDYTKENVVIPPTQTAEVWFEDNNGDQGLRVNDIDRIQGQGETGASRTCYFDLRAISEYKTTSIQPIQIIQHDYANLQYVRGRLVPTTVPSMVSVGPVSLGMTTYTQPIWDNTETTSLTISLRDEGNGDVDNYNELHFYLPVDLTIGIENGSPRCNNEHITCQNRITTHDVTDAQGNCTATLGAYNSLECTDIMVTGNYVLCKYTGDLEESNIVEIITCQIKVPDLGNALRKTYLVRADVDYDYRVTGEASFTTLVCD